MINNLGLCYNGDGIAPEFARVYLSSDEKHTKNALQLSTLEVMIIAMIAKQLYES